MVNADSNRMVFNAENAESAERGNHFFLSAYLGSSALNLLIADFHLLC